MGTGESFPILILDPGHGGLDGGAVSVTGTPESQINWDLAKRCLDLAHFCGLRAVMTRKTFEIGYPTELRTIAARKKWDTRERTTFINSLPNGVLLSIHQNYYPAAAPRGAQVLYASDDQSRELAERMQAAFSQTRLTEERRVAVPAGKDIYIMAHVKCPAILAECGFLSNPGEAEKLETSEHQRKLSVVMVGVMCSALRERT